MEGTRVNIEIATIGGAALGGLIVGLVSALATIGKQVNRQVGRRLQTENGDSIPDLLGEVRTDVKAIIETVHTLEVRQAGIVGMLEQDAKDRVLRQALMDRLCQDCRDRISRMETQQNGRS